MNAKLAQSEWQVVLGSIPAIGTFLLKSVLLFLLFIASIANYV